MPDWTTFVAGTSLLIIAVIILSRLTASTTTGTDNQSFESIPIGTLYLNILFTHGILALLILILVYFTGVPMSVFKISISTPSISEVLLGIGVGAVLYIINEFLAVNLNQAGISHDETLRQSLTPNTVSGWLSLYVIILPLIAFSEELIFRAAMIGGFEAGTGISPWFLVAISSVAFALGHETQGSGGVIVTGLLGGILGVVFVVTDSFLIVFVAHYVINAAEFGVHELLDIELEQRLRV
ncbi:CPBP family intramembrane metalloprotease [Salinarchaeum sp. IM2453]|uniref:CPBP family intramembrane glutamic endopeptidase n=1 Tax=Salinarchaeum sp. IM2453 TaxID=2862870 RepID=UPI001C82E5CD|nr:CPBP family intramembrane glutamic endopeptidase [Salinarchaeum sp. IM2453]QZA88748.1 CPBP family intramembrane metalloprotease [Salinarchaeum sp. IM2453]